MSGIERRNLVLCLDGTSNEIGPKMTNVARIFAALEKSKRQVVFYGSGVGSLDDGVAISWLGRMARKGIDLGIAYRLGAQVLEAYLFLCANYQPGDRVALIGYSRGAFAARAVAGMVKMFGLLKRDHFNQAPYLWKLISTKEDTDLFATAGFFRKNFSNPPVYIDFVGVFDTVSSFGLFTKLRTIPFSVNNKLILRMRQAAAIDEKRAYFPVMDVPAPPQLKPNEPPPPVPYDYKQVWFAGVHSDIGGGGKRSQLPRAKVALEWMLGEIHEAGLHLDMEGYEDMLDKPAPTDRVEFSLGKSWSVVWLLFGLVPMRAWSDRHDRFTWRFFQFVNHRPVADGACVHELTYSAKEAGYYRARNYPKRAEKALTLRPPLWSAAAPVASGTAYLAEEEIDSNEQAP